MVVLGIISDYEKYYCLHTLAHDAIKTIVVLGKYGCYAWNHSCNKH